MESTGLDLGAYLARIGTAAPDAPTLEALNVLHEAHVGAIPFENLDILLGRPIALDLKSLQTKLVTTRRGGRRIGPAVAGIEVGSHLELVCIARHYLRLNLRLNP